MVLSPLDIQRAALLQRQLRVYCLLKRVYTSHTYDQASRYSHTYDQASRYSHTLVKLCELWHVEEQERFLRL
jgi:hypothetical protein